MSGSLPESETRGLGPLYLRVAASLRRQIARGELRPREKLPSIAEMAERHAVSVITVRQAIELLEGEGLIQRFQGRGTFVRDAPGVGANLTLRSDWNSLLEHLEGKRPTLLQMADRVATPPALPEIGTLEPEYRFMRRVHSFEETPYALVDIYLSQRISDLDPEGFKAGMVISRLSSLEAAGVARMRQHIAFTTADEEIARHLSLPLYAAIGDVTRVITDREGRAIYIGLTKYRGDFVTLEFDIEEPPK